MYLVLVGLVALALALACFWCLRVLPSTAPDPRPAATVSGSHESLIPKLPGATFVYYRNHSKNTLLLSISLLMPWHSLPGVLRETAQNNAAIDIRSVAEQIAQTTAEPSDTRFAVVDEKRAFTRRDIADIPVTRLFFNTRQAPSVIEILQSPPPVQVVFRKPTPDELARLHLEAGLPLSPIESAVQDAYWGETRFGERAIGDDVAIGGLRFKRCELGQQPRGFFVLCARGVGIIARYMSIDGRAGVKTDFPSWFGHTEYPSLARIAHVIYYYFPGSRRVEEYDSTWIERREDGELYLREPGVFALW